MAHLVLVLTLLIWSISFLAAARLRRDLNPPLANLWAWLFEGATLKPPFVLGATVLLAGVAAIVLPPPRLAGPEPSENPA